MFSFSKLAEICSLKVMNDKQICSLSLPFRQQGGPKKEQVATSTFEFYLLAKGHKKSSPSETVTKTLYIKGPELAYDCTSLFLLNAGLVILEELANKNKGKRKFSRKIIWISVFGYLRSDSELTTTNCSAQIGNEGVVTPGYAFRRTNYVDRIRDLGVEWKIVENKQ